MIKFYFWIIGFFFVTNVNAQIIDIPDANFKAKLLATNYGSNDAMGLINNPVKIDSNNDGEIEVSEVLQVYFLNVSISNISNLKGIEYFSNLKYLYVSNNYLTDLDLTKLTNLTQLYCNNNSLTSLNVDGLNNLVILYCHENKLTNLNLINLKGLVQLYCDSNKLVNLNTSGSDNIATLYCKNNLLQYLDISNKNKLLEFGCSNNNLEQINFTGCGALSSILCDNNNLVNLDLSDCSQIYLQANNNNLEILNLKNDLGVNDLFLSNNPNLKYICVEEDNIDKVQYILDFQKIKNCSINSYCSFAPGNTYFTIKGNCKLDSNNNGCDTNDSNYLNLNLKITDGINNGDFISNTAGNYNIPVSAGNQTITPIIENSNYFAISPQSLTVNFPTDQSPFTQNFCITPKGNYQDTEVTVLATLPARPGFDTTYKIIYKNKATKTVSGSVTLDFNDAVLDFVSSSPLISSSNINKLVWDYTDLKPLETREIDFTLNVNSPMETPAVNINDRLSFNAVITPVNGDERPVDNSFALRQTVVGSFDPNDKTCLEGDVVTPELIGEYVHYLIRFENTGTYPAENVVVKDMIDLSKFDISTLVLTSASHSYITKISDGNKVEFIFEKINLSFDDANNDGYIAFKIKTLPTLAVGDSFTNEANIYFDYNFPILTNKATSTFKTTLGDKDFEFSKYFSIYPNPVNDVLNLSKRTSIEVESISVYDILGQLVIAVPDAENVSALNISTLRTGNYLLKIKSDKGTSSTKFIKK
jgi:hypothetical protein